MLIVDDFISEEERDLLIDSFTASFDAYRDADNNLGTDASLNIGYMSRADYSSDPEVTCGLLADIEERFTNIIESYTDGYFAADWFLRMPPGGGLKLHTDNGPRPDKDFVETGILNMNVGIREYHVEGEVIPLGDRSLVIANTSMIHGFYSHALESKTKQRYSILFREEW